MIPTIGVFQLVVFASSRFFTQQFQDAKFYRELIVENDGEENYSDLSITNADEESNDGGHLERYSELSATDA